MALSSAECEELIEIAQKKSVVLMTGHTFSLFAGRPENQGNRRARRHRRHPVYLRATAESRTVSKGHQRGVGFGATRHFHHSIYHGRTADCRELPRLRAHHGRRRRRHDDLPAFPKQRTAIIHNSWLDPRKVREMTIVGSKRN